MKNLINIIQFDPTVGDITGNTEKIIDEINRGKINVTSEMATVGYPPQDLLYENKLFSEQQRSIERISKSIENGLVVLGAPQRENGYLYNSALVIDKEGVKNVYSKNLLPTYDVFNEARYFQSDEDNLVFNYNDERIGVTICEDAWSDVTAGGIKQHAEDPISSYIGEDLDIMLNLSASPYRHGKPQQRVDRFREHSKTLGCPVVFANQLGANDELIFDGGSFITSAENVVYSEPSFQNNDSAIPIGDIEELVDAIKIGISDYFDKTGFEKAIIGMSGGIDSSVATTLVSDALGTENVFGVSLPSSVSSKSSVQDAREVAKRLGINFEVVNIEDVFSLIKSNTSDQGYDVTGITSENLQARTRGVYLMAISNSMDNSLVITPDNKSEGAVGYCTLYGDTVGAIAPLGDLYKEKVYEIAEYYNNYSTDLHKNPLPEEVINKEPTAELKQDQSDSDDLPDYGSLDSFLYQYINEENAVDSIQSELTDKEVNEVVSRIHRSEFKRNQSPIVLRVSKKDLSSGWRYPIAANYDFLN